MGGKGGGKKGTKAPVVEKGGNGKGKNGGDKGAGKAAAGKATGKGTGKKAPLPAIVTPPPPPVETGLADSNSRLTGKPYKAAIEDVLGSTKVRPSDFDQKAVQLLDYLHKHGGRAPDALKFLKEAASGVERDDIHNSRAYVYALLRKFDENAYKEMKATSGADKPPRTGGGSRPEPTVGDASSREPLQGGYFGKQPPPPPDHEALDLNPEAPEFNPGSNWGGRLVGATPTAPAAPPAPPAPPYPYPYAAYPQCYGGMPTYPQGYPYGYAPAAYPTSYPMAMHSTGGIPPPPSVPANVPQMKGKSGRKGEGKGAPDVPPGGASSGGKKKDKTGKDGKDKDSGEGKKKDKGKDKKDGEADGASHGQSHVQAR
eukprot:CAMPEP_0206469632 /NCGR_PEP_ID=MMETSP0324_2-20121206/30402_1 /ASSEMBLY_ACC=CAM_ASM_000836 /TAXON_ID=2866 /ORGANISM="Crypthecodinium cohnii, Strain Seligo" /LENGTH=369 /DNA_ID=CAMNT_0053943441 /DNA_START=112 /DNA_END=1221 /DNA_ORIENTATION=+